MYFITINKKNPLISCLKQQSFNFKKTLFWKCLILFILWIPTHAQAWAGDDNQKITINLENVPLQELFKTIERKTNYSFLYRNEWLKNTTKISINVKNTTINTILDKCLPNFALQYAIVDETIIIQKKEPVSNKLSASLSIESIQKAAIITGKVTDEDGLGIPGVSVKVKGSTLGVSTQPDGSFQITANMNETLVFTSIGFEAQEKLIVNTNPIIIILKAATNELKELVVTAFGIKRLKNNLPYAAQQVNGEDISKTRSNNVAGALSGKVSGLQIKQGNAMGSSVNIVIRGMKSLSGNNQALFVVDGVPIDNSNKNTSGQQTGRGGYDYGNAAADINPDDVASINVLKGAAASALYGSRAANGVIMITTKKGNRGFGIVVNAGMSAGNIDKFTFPKYQNEYGAGYSDPYQKDGFLYFDVNGDGVKDLVVPTAQNASYGTKFDPNLMVYHWDAFGDQSSPYYKTAKPWVAGLNTPEVFYETALNYNTSIFFDGASDKGMFKLGYTRNDEKGTLPNSSMNKNLINFGASYSITDKLSVSSTVNYSKIDAVGRYGTGYAKGNVNMYFRQFYQTNIDILEQKAAFFRNPERNFTTNWSDPSVSETALLPFHSNNFYWTRYNNYENDTRNRFFGNIEMNLKATDWLSFLGRITLDYYNEFQEERIAVSSSEVPSYSRLDRTYSEMNYDLMATANKELSDDLSISGLLGLNMRRNLLSSDFKNTVGGLVVPWLYNIGNSVGLIPAPVESYQPKAVDGYFAGGTLTYKQFLTLDASFRRDRSSTLPADANAYNYYAVSGSWLFSKHLQNIPWISSAKLTANYATVGNDAPWGSLANIYNKPSPFGSTVLFAEPTTRNNSQLRPEETKSKEIGLSLSLLRSRLNLDASYYHTNTIDQILPVSVSTATGYSNMYVNAGNIQNNGVEISLSGTPIKTSNLSWNIAFNWSRNRNKVISLYHDSQNLLLGSFQNGVSVNATVGQPYGTIQGKTWQYVNGQKLVGSNGRYVSTSTTNNIIGNVNPDWVGGIYNTFTYKKVSLGFLIDIQKGGDLYSLDMDYGLAAGILPETVALNDLNNPSRNLISNGGGVILPGVNADGKSNTKRVENIFGTYGYVYNPPSAAVYDASYVKLRELTINYPLPTKWFTGVKSIKGVELSIIGRNLWLIHKNLPYSDPEENLSSGNVQGYQAGAYPTTRTFGFNFKVTL